jgi:hypothetical protein
MRKTQKFATLVVTAAMGLALAACSTSSTTTTTAKSNTLAKTGDPASVVGVAALAASGVAAMALGVRKKR